MDPQTPGETSCPVDGSINAAPYSGYILHNAQATEFMVKHSPESPRDICRRLEADGWVLRKGKGDHRNYNKPRQPSVIMIDMGVREIPIGTLRSIYREAGWDW
jgi:predicted RNA binding protein YcfA (HicA-like mRNA interferase family)